MPSTTIPYMYRDADNFKALGTIYVSGEVTSEQIERVRATLEADMHFVPGQISDTLDHLGTQLENFPNEDTDHCWHELLLDEVIVSDELGVGTMTPSEFVGSFEHAADEGWDATYYLDSLGL